MKLFCLCAEDAEVSWLKDEEEIHEDDEHIKISSSEGEHWLEIAFPELRDSAKYTCRIVKFGKEGESETSCHIEVTGKVRYKKGQYALKSIIFRI